MIAAMICLITIFVIGLKYFEPKIIAFVVLLFSGFLVNAAVCATLSGVVERYQSRLIWLAIFAAIVIMCIYFNKNRQR